MKRPFALAVSIVAVAACSTTERSATTDVSGNALPTGPASSGPSPVEPAEDTAAPPAVTDTPSADTAAPTPSVTTPAEAARPPADTGAAPASPTSGTTVVYAGAGPGLAWTPLAIWDGTAWRRTYDDTGDVPIPAATFAAVSALSIGLPAPVTGLRFSADHGDVCVDDRTGPFLDVGATVAPMPGGLGFGYEAVAVAGDWDVQPRPVEPADPDADELRAAGAAIVSTAGVDPAGGDVVQAIQADLDGDGVDEILVTFEKITEGFGTTGDFSVVYARFPGDDGTVVDQVLFEHYPEGDDFPSLGSATVMAIGDLNGDAVMEVVTTSSFWESSIVELYELRDGRLVGVADSGCSL